jgi:hypothetical protein
VSIDSPDWRRCAKCCGAVILALGTLAGCTSATTEPALPTPAPTATATAGVPFAVNVTAVATPARKRIRPRPTPTSFARPKGAFIYLSPNVGPPISRTITVIGGNLPHTAALQLVWSPGGHSSPIATSAYTGAHGGLTARFTVPASPPGSYGIVARVDGIAYARATYRVMSSAVLAVTMAPASDGEELQATGRHFLPRARILLAAYPLFKGKKPLTLGVVETSQVGALSFRTVTRRLVPGEYVLRAWSVSSLTMQLAETYFQVVL